MSVVDVKQAPARTLGRAAQVRTRPRSSVWQQIWRDRIMLRLIAPGLIYFVLFRYIPLLGNVIAFQDYLPFVPIVESPFVGFANFQQMVNDTASWQATPNTITIAQCQLIFSFPMPIILAMMLQSIISIRVRRVIQSVV